MLLSKIVGSCGKLFAVSDTRDITSSAILDPVPVDISAAIDTTPEKTTQRQDTTEPPYKVILHNDDFTPMEHVIITLRKVIPRMSMKRAQEIMLEAHTKGKAVVVKCHKELAELYEESLRSEGLVATIEPD
jgi:ATP-dependent Clp protease adaptor protein ClpS